jgi:cytidylate kinase
MTAKDNSGGDAPIGDPPSEVKDVLQRLAKTRRHQPVITVCMEPGSDGSRIAETVAAQLGFDYFHRKLTEVMSYSAQVSTRVLEKLEKERLSGVQDFISSLVYEKYLHTDIYLEYLEKVVRTLSRRGHTLIVGRGANFILPPKERLSVRVVAPLEDRIHRVAERFGVLPEEAERRVANRQAKRAGFVKKTFKKNISDPVHYDLVINTGTISVVSGARLVGLAWVEKFF